MSSVIPRGGHGGHCQVTAQCHSIPGPCGPAPPALALPGCATSARASASSSFTPAIPLGLGHPLWFAELSWTKNFLS